MGYPKVKVRRVQRTHAAIFCQCLRELSGMPSASTRSPPSNKIGLRKFQEAKRLQHLAGTLRAPPGWGLALYAVGVSSSHFERGLNPARPGLPLGIFRRFGTMACIRTAASPNEVYSVRRKYTTRVKHPSRNQRVFPCYKIRTIHQLSNHLDMPSQVGIYCLNSFSEVPHELFACHEIPHPPVGRWAKSRNAYLPKISG
jgi:hypothetical protein